jgi:tetratricopeptide (TPR) repeat protein
MINVVDLEDRWVKFKIKSYIPYVVIISSVIIISILALIFLKDNNTQTDVKLAENQNPKEVAQDLPSISNTKIQQDINNVQQNQYKVSNVQQPAPAPTTIAMAKQTNTKMVLKPSLSFMKEMQSNTLPYYENKQDIPNKSVEAPVEDRNTIKLDEIRKIQTEPETLEVEKNTIVIDRQNSSDDIQHVIKRFKVNNSPALSLFIAKKYYEMGDYHKSYNYALITNEINKNIEASWIVFAKSLVKLNEKEMAIKTLKTYYQHSSSNKAKILLDEIISGKFK